MPDRNLIILSRATYLGASGATAAATYAFFTSDYKPPAQERSIEQDVVHNQNGKFKWLYDNGPGFKKWSPFTVRCENGFTQEVGATAGAQYERLLTLWEHPGVLGMRAPDGVHLVHWATDIERAFRVFPSNTGDALEYEVVVQFEEAQ